jgi:hypothetical protein
MPTNWHIRFDDPIPLPDGGQLVMLREAGEHIARLPKTLHDSDRWQLAIRDLMRAATDDPACFRSGEKHATSGWASQSDCVAPTDFIAHP